MNPIPFPIVDSHRAGRRPAHLPSLEQKHVPGKVIITCAITGAIHTPSMSPHLPIQPEHIAREAIAAAEAGAAILHLHARNPENGKPDQTPEAFARFLPQVKQGTNAVINITSGGSPYMRVEERVRPAAQFKPEVALAEHGLDQLRPVPPAEQVHRVPVRGEREHLEATRDLIFRNSFKDIEYILSTCYDNGTRFEFECYDIAHLYNLAHFADRGLVKAPFFVQSVFGLLGGIGTHPEDVIHMRRTADRLFGKDYRWSVLGAGASQFRIAAQSAAMGGNVRWVWRTACGPARAGWRSRTPNRCARCGRSSRAWACRSPRRGCPPHPAAQGRRPGGVLNQRRQACASRFWPTSRPRWAKGPCGTWTSSGCTGSTVSTAGYSAAPPTAASCAPGTPQKIGSMALRKQGGAVSLARGFHFLDFRSGEVELIVDPEPDKPANRLNDGKVDRQGRFYAGSMDTQEAGPNGALYRLDPDLSLHRLDTGIVVSNGPCWSPDGRTFYFADTWSGEIWAYDCDPASGAISNRRTFTRVDMSGGGAADGSTVDAEGYLWNAQVYDGKLVRYAPDGSVDRVIEMPVKKVTSVMFGGSELDVLYVTSMAKPPLPRFPQDGVARGSLSRCTGWRARLARAALRRLKRPGGYWPARVGVAAGSVAGPAFQAAFQRRQAVGQRRDAARQLGHGSRVHPRQRWDLGQHADFAKTFDGFPVAGRQRAAHDHAQHRDASAAQRLQAEQRVVDGAQAAARGQHHGHAQPRDQVDHHVPVIDRHVQAPPAPSTISGASVSGGTMVVASSSASSSGAAQGDSGACNT